MRSGRPDTKRSTLVLALAAIPLAAGMTLLRPVMQGAWPARHYLAVHTLVELFVVVFAFATFAVQWYASGARLDDARARLIGSAFLAVGLLEAVHLLAFPGMPGLLWLESSTERGIVYWLAARLWAVGALLVAIAIPRGAGGRFLRRGPLLAATLGGVALVLVLDRFWIPRQPVFSSKDSSSRPPACSTRSSSAP